MKEEYMMFNMGGYDIEYLVERYMDFSDIEEDLEGEEDILKRQRDEFNNGKPLKHSFIKDKVTTEPNEYVTDDYFYDI